MDLKLRIGVLGAGGVGGYFGGLLAGKYDTSENIEVVLITRPATEKIIREDGLKIITPENQKIIFPVNIFSDPGSVGQLDLLICSVKSYDLEESISLLKNNISNRTIILPLLNGVDAKERIQKIYPDSQILEGCVYIVSQQIQPGVINITGNMHSLHFGSDTVNPEQLANFDTIFKAAGIESHLSKEIQKIIWEKFIFVSTLATLTSYLDLSIGEILENSEFKEILINLLNEIKSVAEAKNIRLSENIVENTITNIQRLPYEATTSMHRDFRKKGKTELSSLTEYISKTGKTVNISTPFYDKILQSLQNLE